MKRVVARIAVVFIIVLLCAGLLLVFFDPCAVQEPGSVETFLASTALRVLVWRKARDYSVPPRPADRQASVQEGETLYGQECGDCHGLDGRSPTDEGRWMYPRAADLTSSIVQRYSDKELFWIVKNGVRFSGMPAFARVETDEHIWNLVQYLRTLKNNTVGAVSQQ